MWQPCFKFFRARLIDGDFARGNLMRRRVDGAWQYRRMTDAEAMDLRAW